MKEFVSGLVAFSVLWSVFLPFVRTANGQILGKAMDIKLQSTPPGLAFRLSEGVEGAETREKQVLAETDPLSEGDAGKLLGRLPAIKTDPDDQADFAKRVGTLPAPKTGNKIPIKFPADDKTSRPNVDGAKTALEVIRFSPEGER